MTGQAGDDGSKYIELMVQLKYLSNFWRILEMRLILFGHGLQIVLLFLLTLQIKKQHLK